MAPYRRFLGVAGRGGFGLPPSWRGAVIETELRAAQGSPAYAYQLNYRSSLEGGRYGAMHTMDIALVFDNIAQPGSLTGTGDDAQKRVGLRLKGLHECRHISSLLSG